MNIKALNSILQCPKCGGELIHDSASLTCQNVENHHFPIDRRIPRFTKESLQKGYVQHWNTYAWSAAKAYKLSSAESFVKWVESEAPSNAETSVWLDLGCGDGNHIPYLPEQAVKLAIDLTQSVDLVAKRYPTVKKLYPIQADGQQLPLKDNSVDVALAYGSFNCIPNPKKAIGEAARVLRPGGILALWGYGTKSPLIRTGFWLARGLYRSLPGRLIRRLMILGLVPSLYFIKSSTGVRFGKNTWKECCETISLNLSAETLHIFGKDSWADHCPEQLEYLSDYKLYCGQKFRKNEVGLAR